MGPRAPDAPFRERLEEFGGDDPAVVREWEEFATAIQRGEAALPERDGAL